MTWTTWRQRNHDSFTAWEREYRRNFRLRLIGDRDRCDICGDKATHLCLDHCHEFAKQYCAHKPESHCVRCRRGVLCKNCNTGLGKFHENLALLGNGKIGRYIRKWNKKLNLGEKI